MKKEWYNDCHCGKDHGPKRRLEDKLDFSSLVRAFAPLIIVGLVILAASAFAKEPLFEPMDFPKAVGPGQTFAIYTYECFYGAKNFIVFGRIPAGICSKSHKVLVDVFEASSPEYVQDVLAYYKLTSYPNAWCEVYQEKKR